MDGSAAAQQLALLARTGLMTHMAELAPPVTAEAVSRFRTEAATQASNVMAVTAGRFALCLPAGTREIDTRVPHRLHAIARDGSDAARLLGAPAPPAAPPAARADGAAPSADAPPAPAAAPPAPPPPDPEPLARPAMRVPDAPTREGSAAGLATLIEGQVALAAGLDRLGREIATAQAAQAEALAHALSETRIAAQGHARERPDDVTRDRAGDRDPGEAPLQDPERAPSPAQPNAVAAALQEGLARALPAALAAARPAASGSGDAETALQPLVARLDALTRAAEASQGGLRDDLDRVARAVETLSTRLAALETASVDARPRADAPSRPAATVTPLHGRPVEPVADSTAAPAAPPAGTPAAPGAPRKLPEGLDSMLHSVLERLAQIAEETGAEAPRREAEAALPHWHRSGGRPGSQAR